MALVTVFLKNGVVTGKMTAVIIVTRKAVLQCQVFKFQTNLDNLNSMYDGIASTVNCFICNQYYPNCAKDFLVAMRFQNSLFCV